MTLTYHPSSRTIRKPDWYNKNAHIISDTSSLDKIYIGIVKDTKDPQRMGRIMLVIPEIGGEINKPESWIIASYCSPFAGSTLYDIGIHKKTDGETKFVDNHQYHKERAKNRTPEMGSAWGGRQSYGMWFVPPDVGNEVLVCFVNGDPNRAVWMGCLWPQDANHMIPGIAESDLTTSTNTSQDETGPSIEHDPRQGFQGFDGSKRRQYTFLRDGLRKQGLDKDDTYLRGGQRGQAKSTAQREAPSEVFGILTPDGNHFVMDDGVFDEKKSKNNPNKSEDNRTHEFIRLRTKSGAQLIINETDGFIYMISRDGTTWIELSNDGNVDIYGNSNISIHAESGNINFKAGNDINLQAGGNINIRAENDFRGNIKSDYNMTVEGNRKVQIAQNDSLSVGGFRSLSAGGQISETSGTEIREQAPFIFMNSGSGTIPQEPILPLSYTPVGPSKILEDGTWEPGGLYIDGSNIIVRVPQHEPWIGRRKSQSPTPKQLGGSKIGSPTPADTDIPSTPAPNNQSPFSSNDTGTQAAQNSVALPSDDAPPPGSKDRYSRNERLLISGGNQRGSYKVPPQEVYNYLRNEKGLTHNQASGIMANIQAESAFRSDAVGDNGSAIGLFQHNTVRMDGLYNQVGENWRTDWRGQIDYALSEPAGKKYISRQFQTPEDASRDFTLNFERPANKEQKAEERARTVRIYDQYLNTT